MNTGIIQPAYRGSFFPAQADDDFGYCLHQADLAINKILSLAGRNEVHDLLDIIFLHSSYLSLGAIVWAACGKDPGYTPSLLLDMANRHVCYRDSDLQGEHLVKPVDLRELKALDRGSRDGRQPFVAITGRRTWLSLSSCRRYARNSRPR